MVQFVHGKLRWEEEATSIPQSHPCALTAMPRMLHMWLQVDLFLLQLDVIQMVQMLLSGIHWLHQSRQTSIMCHEGGARSLSVFDNDIGCGSISPLIVTGGKGGDVALHDFRFISTGKSKHHRSSNENDVKASSMHDTKSGTSVGGSSNGMIWHIPKAHLGSVTSISTIPNTSLVLTGSKDGDVKLWDAKNFTGKSCMSGTLFFNQPPGALVVLLGLL